MVQPGLICRIGVIASTCVDKSSGKHERPRSTVTGLGVRGCLQAWSSSGTKRPCDSMRLTGSDVGNPRTSAYPVEKTVTKLPCIFRWGPSVNARSTKYGKRLPRSHCVTGLSSCPFHMHPILKTVGKQIRLFPVISAFLHTRCLHNRDPFLQRDFSIRDLDITSFFQSFGTSSWRVKAFLCQAS